MDLYKGTLDEFKQFLKDHKEHLNAATTYNLISSHGCVDELLYYATIMEDFERVIGYYIQAGDYIQALQKMSSQTSEEIFYKFSPIVMYHVPFDTVDAWIKATNLNPRKLIPALMRYDPAKNPKGNKTNQAIRYLQHCVGKLQNKDPALHNYLLSLYAQEDEKALLAFLSPPAGGTRYYDLKYALRVCTQHNQKTACVHIYSQMGLYEEAVNMALKVDIELAKINANKPEDDDALRKKLWLRIARHVVEEDRNIKKAIEFLKQCDLLKIEDILPFFPDFVEIDVFKDEICTSLENYNKHIEELKQEMEDATASADLIRADIKELRNKYGYVAANQKCDICKYPVLTRQFYLFPCQHVFHSDCLLNEVSKTLSDNQKKKRITAIKKSTDRRSHSSDSKT